MDILTSSGFPTPCFSWECIQDMIVEHPYVVFAVLAIILYLAWHRSPTYR